MGLHSIPALCVKYFKLLAGREVVVISLKTLCDAVNILDHSQGETVEKRFRVTVVPATARWNLWVEAADTLPQPWMGLLTSNRIILEMKLVSTDFGLVGYRLF